MSAETAETFNSELTIVATAVATHPTPDEVNESDDVDERGDDTETEE